jgi:hypothetical protein
VVRDAPSFMPRSEPAFGTVAAYVWRAICAAECSAILALGSNDGVLVWLSGEEVWSQQLGRILKKDEDRVPVRLRSGRNTLLGHATKS